MPGERRFRTALYGFKKDDVNQYIEEMLQKFEANLKERDERIALLKNENKKLDTKYNELAKSANQINEDRARIADVLIKAEEKAQLIVEEGKTRAMKERNEIEQIIEKEKEKLIDVKEEMRALRKDIVTILKKYDTQLGSIVDEKG